MQEQNQTATIQEQALPVCEQAQTAEQAQNSQSEEKRLKLFGVEVVYLCFLGILLAFIGWVAENAAKLVTTGFIDSRFHVLPFVPVYGIVVFAVYLVFGNPDDIAFFGRRAFKQQTVKTKILSNVICLACSYAAVFFGELIVGNAMEALTGVQLWNYTALPLTVTQYAGLIPTLGYGTGAYLLVKFALWPSIRLLQNKVNYKIIRIITVIVSLFLIADELAMFLNFFILGEGPVYWTWVIFA
ncbi:MAG: putative ABC transporter permease [Clostridia bacterium]|nr:putative ABC transporter permease [Clostridia bacterium]